MEILRVRTKLGIQDIPYQNEQLANAQTKIDIKQGVLRGGCRYWNILPTTSAMIGFYFSPTNDNMDYIPEIHGSLGANEYFDLYTAIVAPDGTFQLGVLISSNSKPVEINSGTNYGDVNLTGKYCYVKSATAQAIGLVLIPPNPVRNIVKDLYL